MSTFFYCKNRLHFSLWLLLGACFSLLIFLYASLFSGLERVANRKVFYYLVQDSMHVEASVYNVSLNGGAGYVLEENGRFYAVYAVYFFRDKANEQALGLRERGEKVKIL